MFNLNKIFLKNFLLLFIFKGFISDIFLAYKGLKHSFDNQFVSGVNENRLLAYAFFISFILFLQRLPDRVIQNKNSIDVIGIDLYASIFYVPIFLYIIASFIHILS